MYFYQRPLIPQGLIRPQVWGELSNERVVEILRSDWSNQSVMRFTIQKMVETKGNNNPSEDSQREVYSQPL